MAAHGKAAGRSTLADDQQVPDVGLESSKSNGSGANMTFLQSSSTNGSSIFNALRASSVNEEEVIPKADSGNEMLRVDSRMAGNIAMLLPLSSADSEPSRPRMARCVASRNSDHVGTSHMHPLPGSGLPSLTGEVTGVALPEGLSRSSLPAEEHPSRKANSLDDAGNIPRQRRCTGNLPSPVRPTLPTIPPPIRSPTPPGLPSFGTREAERYAARFSQEHANRQRREVERRNSEESIIGYVTRRLRFFAVACSSLPPPSSQQTCSPSRAEGLVPLLGRFPHRQSGHGTHMSRRINDHPFHERELPVAQCDGADAGDNRAVPECSDIRETGDTESRLPAPIDTSNSERIVGTSPERPPETHPPVPQRQETPGCLRGSTFLGTSIPITRVDSYHTCFTQIQAARDSRYIEGPLPANPENVDGASGGSLAATGDTDPTGSTSTTIVPDATGDNRLWPKWMRAVWTIICCCSGLETDPDIPLTSNVNSNDTYVTAREQSSNDTVRSYPSGAGVAEGASQHALP